jgi:hypothetical protein
VLSQEVRGLKVEGELLAVKGMAEIRDGRADVAKKVKV